MKHFIFDLARRTIRFLVPFYWEKYIHWEINDPDLERMALAYLGERYIYIIYTRRGKTQAVYYFVLLEELGFLCVPQGWLCFLLLTQALNCSCGDAKASFLKSKGGACRFCMANVKQRYLPATITDWFIFKLLSLPTRAPIAQRWRIKFLCS